MSFRSYQYFRFVSDEPGFVTVRTGRDAPDQKICILKTPGYRFLSRDRPTTMMPGGLSQERHRYLVNTVRPCVRVALQDEFCAQI